MEEASHTISLVVKNKPDVLARISGLLSGRGFNIESISANVTMVPGVTKITMVTKGDVATVVKIEKQMKKLVDVIEVFHVKETEGIQREMVLVRLKVNRGNRGDVMKVVEACGARIVDEGPDFLSLEITGANQDVNGALTSLEALDMDDMSRSGVVIL